MNFFSRIFSHVKKEELVLVIDVGSSSVGGALFWAQGSGVPEIIFSIREPIALEKEINPERVLSLPAKALEILAGKIAGRGLGAPKKIFCVLSSPWYASQTRTISMQKNTPFVFNSKLADSLIAKEIGLFEEEHLKKYIEGGSKIVAIELKNMKTTLNGYTTPEPFNKKTKELEMIMFISMSGEQVLQKIEKTIMRHFYFRAIKFSSFTMASFAVVRDMCMRSNSEDFLLVDIGGETTEISMVKKNLLCESVSYPMGHNFMIRSIASTLGSGLDEAKSLFFLYKDGHAEEKLKEKIEPMINDLKTEWLKKFQTSLANLSNDISIPATIFITIDKEYEDFFAEIIKTEQFNQYTLTEAKFQIVFLNTEILHGIASFENDTIRDTFLIINAIYINRFVN